MSKQSDKIHNVSNCRTVVPDLSSGQIARTKKKKRSHINPFSYTQKQGNLDTILLKLDINDKTT